MLAAIVGECRPDLPAIVGAAEPCHDQFVTATVDRRSVDRATGNFPAVFRHQGGFAPALPGQPDDANIANAVYTQVAINHGKAVAQMRQVGLAAVANERVQFERFKDLAAAIDRGPTQGHAAVRGLAGHLAHLVADHPGGFPPIQPDRAERFAQCDHADKAMFGRGAVVVRAHRGLPVHAIAGQ